MCPILRSKSSLNNSRSSISSCTNPNTGYIYKKNNNMKLKFTVLIAALLVSHFTLMAQEQKVKLEMVNGDQVDFVTDLIIFKGTAVLPDDANDFIKGTVDGKK